jgi:hypothetical protein
MDDIVKICDRMDECEKKSLCNYNPIICAKSLVKLYVKDDYNKILLLEAQAKIYKNNSLIMEEFPQKIISTLVVANTFLLSLCQAINDNDTKKIIIGITFILCFLIIALWALNKIAKKLAEVFYHVDSRRKNIIYLETALYDVKKSFKK